MISNKRIQPLFSILIAVLVTGCGTTGTLSERASQLTEKVKENAATVQGCVLGAVGISLTKHVRTRSKEYRVVAALAGCALGAAAAKEFDDRRKKYANLQEFHSAEITNTKQLNAQLSRDNANYKLKSANYDRQLRALKKSSNGRSAKAKKLREQVVAARELAENTRRDALIEISMKDELSERLQKSGDTSRANSLKAEADKYQAKIDALNDIIEGYNRQSADIGGLI